jgi:hypothetical protein
VTDVGAADEAGDELGRRPVVEILRRAVLHHLALSITAMRSEIAIASSWSWVT